MPQIQRKPAKLTCKGLNISLPPDILPDGYFPKLVNTSIDQFGVLQARTGSAQVAALADSFVHSLRRLNNTIPGAASSATLLAGAGTNLYSGNPPGGAPIAAGFSGNPLSMLPYRPDQSPEPWMYIADQNKLVKVNSESVVRGVGIVPPRVPPQAEIAPPYYKDISMTTGGTPGYIAVGTASGAAQVSRVPGSVVVGLIIYDTGATGWACIEPTGSGVGYSWLQPGERLVLNSAETVTVESVGNPIATTTIASILYDVGTSGFCSIVLTAQGQGLARNSLLTLNAETVRVLSVIQGPNKVYSFRCVTASTHAAGETVTGLVSFRAYTTTAIVATNTITDVYTLQFVVAVGTGSYSKSAIQDLSTITEFGTTRAVQLDDYMHVSIYLDNPQCLVEGRIEIDVDNGTNDFNHNYYYKAFRANDLTPAANSALPTTTVAQTVISNQSYDAADPRASSEQLALGALQFTELTFPISDLVRVGTDKTRTLANATTIRFQLTVVSTKINNTTYNTITCQFDSWWIGGTYGPNVIINSPTGIRYQYRYRSSATGARSNPSPPNRYPLFPSSQAINLMLTSSTDPQVDLIDIQRFDPELQSSNQPAQWVYIATIPNNAPSYQDQSLTSTILANPGFETDRLQPFPSLSLPLTGTVAVSGTSVEWLTGDKFPLNLNPGTVINIGTPGQSTAYQLFALPKSTTFLELFSSAGNSASVPFQIYSPVLLGTPLAVMFGPLEGPTASFMFGLGDPSNPGTLYWTNGNDPDSASDINTIEITTPSEPLIGGIVWNTLVYVFSRFRVFILRPSFDATGTFQFTFYAIPAPSGLWSSWGLCAGVDGVYYVGSDSVNRIAGETVKSITDLELYPLFPHGGAMVGQGTADYPPINMSATTKLRLSFTDSEIYFNYQDVNGALWTYRLQQPLNAWLPYQYPILSTYQYWEEVPTGVSPRILLLSNTGAISEATGTTDDGAQVNAIARTPSYDGGDPRTQKLYIDVMNDYSGAPILTLGFNNHTVTLPSVALANQPVRSQSSLNVSTIATVPYILTLYRNISGEYTFSAGVQLYEFEPSYYDQPYLVTSILTRGDHGFGDWQVIRDTLMALISTGNVQLYLDIDGNEQNYSLTSTNGQLRKVYQQVAHGSKGRMVIWQLKSDTPFVFFPSESMARIKDWRGDSFNESHIFAGANIAGQT